MRKQFIKTVEDIISKNKKIVLLLGDIGVFGFRNVFNLYPKQVYNIGILEQSMIGVAAGLNLSGLIPIIHTIAPFTTERCFEQIKNDFGYQKLGGNIVSVGGSYDYAALGCTHHCPADVPILMNIPNIQIVVPGTQKDFDTLFKQSYNNGKMTYFRLSERTNQNIVKVRFGKANIIKNGKKATVIVIGPLLDKVINATQKLDVTIIYLTTIRPLDIKIIKNNINCGKILICEPYYSGSIATEILDKIRTPLKIDHLGVPKEFLHKYGKADEHDKNIGFTEKEITKRLKKLINE